MLQRLRNVVLLGADQVPSGASAEFYVFVRMCATCVWHWIRVLQFLFAKRERADPAFSTGRRLAHNGSPGTRRILHLHCTLLHRDGIGYIIYSHIICHSNRQHQVNDLARGVFVCSSPTPTQRMPVEEVLRDNEVAMDFPPNILLNIVFNGYCGILCYDRRTK